MMTTIMVEMMTMAKPVVEEEAVCGVEDEAQGAGSGDS